MNEQDLMMHTRAATLYTYMSSFFTPYVLGNFACFLLSILFVLN